MKKLILLICLSVSTIGALAQRDIVKIRLVDLEKNQSDLTAFTTSSSNEKNEFPVFHYGEKQYQSFDDLYMILVRHDLKASNPDIYIKVELIDLEDRSTIYEMAKYMRISGKKGEKAFSIKLVELNSLEVIRKNW